MTMTRPHSLKIYGKTAPYALVITPWERPSGSVQPVIYDSWERLHAVLLLIGLKKAQTEKVKQCLDNGDGYIADGQVLLSDEQLSAVRS